MSSAAPSDARKLASDVPKGGRWIFSGSSSSLAVALLNLCRKDVPASTISKPVSLQEPLENDMNCS